MDLFRLDGKVALVTGASRGIGEGIALALAEAGADVALSSRKLPPLEEVAGKIRSMGRRALPVAAHSGKPEELKNLYERVREALGSPDILVNNAGTNPIFGPILNVDESLWDKIFDVNVKGAFVLSKLVGQSMIDRGSGSIINVASVGGYRPALGLGAYGITKAAVMMLTKVCATEWASAGVRVNCLAPGLVDTRFSKVLIESPAIYEEAVRRIPMGRHGTVDEMIGAVLYLASDASKFVTGHVLYVDGGAAAM